MSRLSDTLDSLDQLVRARLREQPPESWDDGVCWEVSSHLKDVLLELHRRGQLQAAETVLMNPNREREPGERERVNEALTALQLLQISEAGDLGLVFHTIRGLSRERLDGARRHLLLLKTDLPGDLPAPHQLEWSMKQCGAHSGSPVPAPPASPPAGAPSGRGRRMPVDEANKQARLVAKKQGQGFFTLSIRKQAEAIGCSFDTWRKTEFFKTAKRKKAKLRAQLIRGASAAGGKAAAGLTPAVEAKAGVGKRDQVLDQLIEEEARIKNPSCTWEDLTEAERQAILDEQQADYEPSPLDPADQHLPRTRKRV